MNQGPLNIIKQLEATIRLRFSFLKAKQQHETRKCEAFSVDQQRSKMCFGVFRV